MYEILRKTHLYTGMVLLVFIVMYFSTGYVIIHNRWFPNSQEKTARTEPLPADAATDPEARAVYLQNTFHLSGQRQPPEGLNDGRWCYRYRHPGENHEAVVSAAGDSVRITTTEVGFKGIMNGFHRLRGYEGGGLYILWAFLYDLASLAMILFAASGIYMWYKLTRKRLLGWAFLGIGFGYTAITVLYIVYSP